MTTSAGKTPRPDEVQNELIRDLVEWERDQPKPLTLFEMVEHGDARLLGAYILRGFRRAAKEAVEQHYRVMELSELACVAFGDADEAERFLRAPNPCLGNKTPLEAAMIDNGGRDEAIRELIPQLRGAAMRVFDGLCRAWALSESEQRALLGGDDDVPLELWRASPSLLPSEAIERISLLLGIFRDLNTLLPAPDRADAWLRQANNASLFQGRSALEFMLNRGLVGIYDLRGYLAGEIWGR